jgi:hypothetical protein
MPCRDYYSDSDNHTVSQATYDALKERADLLARVACKALNELESNEVADLLLIKDNEVREWWLQHKEDDRKERLREAKQAKAKLKKEEAARVMQALQIGIDQITKARRGE